MKACPQCGRLYPDDAGFCPVEGTQLTRATQAPPPTDASDERVGTVLFDRYQIRRVVADGGMGRVYEALDLAERRSVALKILHAEVAQDPVQVERFKREFEVSGELPHEHIVDVHDFRPTQDGSYALVMEFLYGEELSATLKREGVLHPGRVVRMASQVAVGLDWAHERQLVHRDLKPDNVFLCQQPDGDRVKVLDFGSVKDTADGAKRLTVMGTTIGSPFYMAPEQAQGLDTLDQRADVWALAAITYECVTGQVPFPGDNGPRILVEILTKEPLSPSQVGANRRYPVPPTLDPVIARALKKTAAVRTASVGRFADELGQAYGLEGDHRVWAELPERELVAAIDRKMPELLQARPVTTPRDAVDEFFGEVDSLGHEGALLGGAAAPAPAAPAPAAPASEPAAPAAQHAAVTQDAPPAVLPPAAAISATTGANQSAEPRDQGRVPTADGLDPMTQAMAAAQRGLEEDDLRPHGVPQGPPRWLLPALAGGLVVLLLVAGGLFLLS